MSSSDTQLAADGSRLHVVLLEERSGELASLRELLECSTAQGFDVAQVSWTDWSETTCADRDFDAVLFEAERFGDCDLSSRIDSVRRVSRGAVITIAAEHDARLLVRVLDAGADGLMALSDLTDARLLDAVVSATHRRRAIRKLEVELECAVHMTNHDRVTNLENRHALERRLSPLLATAARNDRKAGVLFVEASGLKSVNDSLGHHAGDQLLSDVADRLVRSVRLGDDVTRSSNGDTETAISHLGGSEFTVLLSEITNAQDAARVAQRVIDLLSEAFILDGQEVFVRTSVGIAVFPLDGGDADLMLRNAGSAKLQAKHAGGNAFRFYARSMNSEAARRLKMGGLLHRALERGELSLHYQPLRQATSGKLLAGEALLRWSPEELGEVSPAEFVPIAEDTNLIVPIGEWVLRAAAQQHRQWLDRGYEPIRLAVNLSGRQLERPELTEMVARILAETGMSSSNLELEITETTIMQDDERTRRALAELRDMGVGLALDDFGTGFSTLSHLVSFRVDRLKIDRSFISQIGVGSQGADVASALIAMAHSLELGVVAEGVETVEQANFLRERGCDELQGFLLGRPMPAHEFERFLERRKPHASA